MATRRVSGGQGCDAEKGVALPVSAHHVVHVQSREGERGIVPLADEWDPLTIERKRKKKGGAGWLAWLLGRGSEVAPGKEIGGLC
jgi:hypothetical protein